MMDKGKIKYLLIVLVLIATSCFVAREKSIRNKEKTKSLLETQYYKLFTDATKHALFGNYKNAISLYNACIDLKPNQAAPYYQLSSIYLRTKEVDLAASYAEKAVFLDSMNIWYLIQLANIYQFQGSFEKAISTYEKLNKIKDDDEIKYNLAILYDKAGRDEEALNILKTLSEDNRDSREILLMQHNLYNNLRKYDSAIYKLELITKYFPDDMSGYGMLAEYLNEIGRNNYAGRVYRTMMKKDSTNGLVILSFGEFYLKNALVDSAFVLFNKAFCCSDLDIKDKISFIVGYINNKDFITQHADYVIKLMNEIDKRQRKFGYYAAKADIFINLEKYDLAKSLLDTALTYEKNNYLLWEQTLLINSYLGKYDDVIKISSECLNYFKDKPNVYFYRADAYRNIKNDDKALEDIDTILSEKPEKRIKIQTLNLAAEIYRSKTEFVKSDSCFEEILKIDENNLMIRNNYAYYLSLRGEKLNKAEELSRLTIEKEPNNSTYLDTYGWILYKKGEFNKAKSYIESAIRNGAYTNAEVLEHYGDIMNEIGKCNEAIEAFNQAYTINNSKELEEKISKTMSSCE